MQKNSVRGFQETEPLARHAVSSLERSCKTGFADGMHIAPPSRGIERIEARFHGNGFSPHRHDTYALGLTLHGVQTFRYRGAGRFSNPGNVIVLHPDEVHDGAAGTEEGLIYRMIYLPPDLIGAVNGHRTSLPFVADPVVRDMRLWQALADILCDLEHEPGDLALDDVVMRVEAGLRRRASSRVTTVQAAARTAVLYARDILEDCCREEIRSEALEAATGLDRYELARQFRRLLGTSPHHYLVMRRLDRAKQLMAASGRLADVAADAGFADQAHFTRHFRKTFGMTPGRWIALRKNAR
ncbi:AraC family transcriptional regulator [Endobacterium cereale]|nr:AraC family transcriptional regulator [Endobacterium cereale]MEB2844027.1 AraC family transcriptional regulator [Endobacterium cereale]